MDASNHNIRSNLLKSLSELTVNVNDRDARADAAKQSVDAV